MSPPSTDVRDRSKRRFPPPSIDPFFSGSTGTPPPPSTEEDQPEPESQNRSSTAHPCDTPSTTRTFFSTNSGDETNDATDTTIIANNAITRLVGLQSEAEEELILRSIFVPSLESDGRNGPELEEMPEGYAASQTTSTRATENAGGSQSSFYDDSLTALEEILMVPIKVPKGDRVVTERHVKLDYKDGKECLSCLDSLREAVESHRMNQREVDVDEGASVWLCANDECGSFMCTPCAVHWANRELARFCPPTCPRCDRCWEIKTLVDHARTYNPNGPDRPIRPPPINRFVDKHGRSDDLMSGMIKFRNIYRKPDGSEYDSAEAYMFWLVIMINESAGFTYHGSDREKHLLERVWESSYQVHFVDDIDNRLLAESFSEESSRSSSSGNPEGERQSVVPPPTPPRRISGNYETEASRYASEAMNSANSSLRFAQPTVDQQLPVRHMRSEPVMRHRAPLRGLSRQPNFQISRNASGHCAVSINSSPIQMNAAIPGTAQTQPTPPTFSRRTCNSGYFAYGRSNFEAPVVSPFLDMLEGTLRRVAQERNFDNNPRLSEALYYQRLSGAVEQAIHEHPTVADEFGQAKSPRDPVRPKTSFLRTMASVPALAMNKLKAGRNATAECSFRNMSRKSAAEPPVLPTTEVASAITNVGANDPIPVSRTWGLHLTMSSVGRSVGNLRGNMDSQPSGATQLTPNISSQSLSADGITTTGLINGDGAIHVQRPSMPLRIPSDAKKNHHRVPSARGDRRTPSSEALSALIIPQGNSDSDSVNTNYLTASSGPSGSIGMCGSTDSSRAAGLSGLSPGFGNSVPISFLRNGTSAMGPQATLASSIHTHSDCISKSEQSETSKPRSNASNQALFGGADSGFFTSSGSQLFSGPGSDINRMDYGRMESMANSVNSDQVHSHAHAHLPGVDTLSTLTSLNTVSSASFISYEPCLSRPDQNSPYLHLRLPAPLPPPQGPPYSHFPLPDNLGSLRDREGTDGKKRELKGLWRKFMKKR